jgi:hypothetical protein
LEWRRCPLRTKAIIVPAHTPITWQTVSERGLAAAGEISKHGAERIKTVAFCRED